jgi:hypothetical protein
MFSAILAMAASVQATTFNYNAGDVLVCFRKTSGATYDLVVNAGPVSTFTNLTAGSKLVLNPGKYTSAQLGVVGGTNNLSWTVFAYYDASAPAASRYTVFMSDPWPDAVTQPDPWARASSSAQSVLIGWLSSAAFAATNYINTTNASSATASLVPESISISPYNSYKNAVSPPNSDFHGTFQNDPEQSTGPTFSTGGTPVRADFYQLIPYAGFPAPNGVYWGYFEFSTTGVMTYTAGLPPVTPPTIVSITRNSSTTTVAFTTGSTGTYTLRGTNDLTAAKATWPVINSIGGNGGQQSLSDVTADGSKFYIISAQ